MDFIMKLLENRRHIFSSFLSQKFETQAKVKLVSFCTASKQGNTVQCWLLSSTEDQKTDLEIVLGEFLSAIKNFVKARFEKYGTTALNFPT